MCRVNNNPLKELEMDDRSPKTSPTVETYLGNVPEIDETAYVASTAAIMGAVRIGPDCSIWHNVTLRGDANYITIGRGSNIQDNSVVHIDSRTFPAIIGEYVTVGHGAIIHACTLHDNAFIGMGAIVLDGAVVESGAMVAAGALVPPGKTVPAGELWAGSPVKFMRALDGDAKNRFSQTAYSYIEFGRAARLGHSGGPYKFTPVTLPPKSDS